MIIRGDAQVAIVGPTGQRSAAPRLGYVLEARPTATAGRYPWAVDFPKPVDFLSLSDQDFEALTFDALKRVGFVELEWRQGGADQGRDIDCWFDAVSPLFGTVREHWYVQCKRYTSGVPPAPLLDALTWADAGPAQHHLFVVSGHITNASRTWIGRMQAARAYRIHVLEGRVRDGFDLPRGQGLLSKERMADLDAEARHAGVIPRKPLGVTDLFARYATPPDADLLGTGEALYRLLSAIAHGKPGRSSPWLAASGPPRSHRPVRSAFPSS